MLDIDHFKAVNDRYGHASGDAVLKALTRVCRASLRSADTISRWGGEEFLLILPGADDSAAMVAAERVRAAVAATEVSTVDGTVLRFTVSIGVATYNGGNRSVHEFLEIADEALYSSKSSGRNRVTLGIFKK
jgi:diguanylate cyclase (GGDEF)-like protein